MSKGNIIVVIASGSLSAANGYFALENLLNYANTKSAIIQEHLSRAPELTEQAYQAAREAAGKVSSGDLYLGLFHAAVAGLVGSLAIYESCREK